MTEALVTYAARDGVGWITLNRPNVLNALSTELAAALADHAATAATDASVAQVVVRGAGRAFCSGMDRTALAAGAIGGARHRPRQLGVSARRPRPGARDRHREGARRLSHRDRPHQATAPRVVPPRPARAARGGAEGAERVRGVVGDGRVQPRLEGAAGGALLSAGRLALLRWPTTSSWKPRGSPRSFAASSR